MTRSASLQRKTLETDVDPRSFDHGLVLLFDIRQHAPTRRQLKAFNDR